MLAIHTKPLPALLSFSILLLTAGVALAVPEAVERGFESVYPDATAEDWEVDSNGYWEAKFEKDGAKARADFTVDGVWVETEISIKYDDLPDPIKEKIGKNYPDEEIDELEKVDHSTKGVFYDVEFSRKGNDLDIEYREDGTRVRDELGVETMMVQLQEPIGDLSAEQTVTEEMTKIELLTEFGINVITLIIYAGFIYYRRHHDHKMLFLLLGFNLFLFPIFLLSSSLTMGFGFTIFALLALVRLRSDTFSKTEIAYLLGAVSLTFINAMLPARVEIVSSAVVVLTAYFADHPRIWRDGYQTTEIRYRIKDTTRMLDQDFLRRQVAEDFQVEVNDIEIDRVDKNEVRMTVMYRDLPERRREIRDSAKGKSKRWLRNNRAITPTRTTEEDTSS